MTAAREWLDILRYLHGSYNTIIFFAFLYQSWSGWNIRKERLAGGNRTISLVSRHRKNGPVLALLAVMGYVAGDALTYLDKGYLFQFPFHALTGLGIVFFIMLTFLTSRRIRGLLSPWRTPHFVMGLVILFFYVIQELLGLDILF